MTQRARAVDEGDARAVGRSRARARDIIQHPGEFGGGEIGISQKPCAFGQQRFMTLAAKLRAGIGSPTILPDNGAMQAAARCAIPEQRGFALIGDADAGHIASAAASFFQGLM